MLKQRLGAVLALGGSTEGNLVLSHTSLYHLDHGEWSHNAAYFFKGRNVLLFHTGS